MTSKNIVRLGFCIALGMFAISQETPSHTSVPTHHVAPAAKVVQQPTQTPVASKVEQCDAPVRHAALPTAQAEKKRDVAPKPITKKAAPQGVVHVKNKAHLNSLLQDNDLVVVDFFATWCGPCKMMSPILDELAKAGDGIVYVKVDIDDLPEVAQEYDVQAMPTFHMFKGGKKVKTHVGGAKKESFKNTVHAALK